MGKRRLGSSESGKRAKSLAVALHRRLVNDHEAVRSLVLELNNKAEADIEAGAPDDEKGEYGPLFTCQPTKDRTQWWFVCPKCGKENTHSAGPGHRASHCVQGCWPNGYYLRGPRVGK